MKISPDPIVHREREQRLIHHVQRLLEDERLRVDTMKGSRPVISLLRDVNRWDHGVELKRLMSEMGLPDRELQSRMPCGEALEVTLSQKSWWFFKQAVGRLRVLCVSPTKALLGKQDPGPLGTGDLSKLLASQPPSLGGVPLTVVVMSTSGFTIDAHELADRRADRTVILIEPNEAGGWTVTGPAQTKALADLFDPEAEEEKSARVREQIDANKTELS